MWCEAGDPEACCSDVIVVCFSPALLSLFSVPLNSALQSVPCHSQLTCDGWLVIRDVKPTVIYFLLARTHHCYGCITFWLFKHVWYRVCICLAKQASETTSLLFVPSWCPTSPPIPPVTRLILRIWVCVVDSLRQETWHKGTWRSDPLPDSCWKWLELWVTLSDLTPRAFSRADTH